MIIVSHPFRFQMIDPHKEEEEEEKVFFFFFFFEIMAAGASSRGKARQFGSLSSRR